MLVYYLTALSSAIGTKIATYFYFKKNKSNFNLFFSILISIIVICVICSVAGFRNPYIVGTDTKGYLLRDFINARYFEYNYFVNLDGPARYGFLMSATIWLCAHLTRNMFIYMFIIELLVALPIYISCVWFLKKYSWLGMFIFSLFMFLNSFNMIRSSIAEAFFLLAYVCLMKNKKILSVILVIISFLFHDCAFIGIAGIFVFIYLKNYKKILSKNLQVKVVCSISICLLLVFCCQPILTYLFSSDNTYSQYLNAARSSTSGLAILQTVFSIFFIAIFLLLKKKKIMNDVNLWFLVSLFFIGITTYWIGLKFQWLTRIGTFYFTSWILLFPYMLSFIKERNEKIFFAAIVLTFIIVYSTYYFSIKNNGEVCPYVFSNNITIKV